MKNVFLKQAEMIGERFIQKGYHPEFIEDRIKDVLSLDREGLIQDTIKNTENKNTVSLVMDFNIQHKQIEIIFLKYWNIVKADRHLGAILPERPKFMYRRAPTLRDRIAKNVLDPPTKKNFFFE